MAGDEGRTRAAGERARWVGIGEAAAILGVSPATLRRWVDLGKMEAFVTPGGHRRFRHEDIAGRFQNRADARREQAVPLSVASRAGQQEAVLRARRESWYGTLSAKEVQVHKARGRDLLGLIEAYLARPERRPALMDEIERKASVYGREGAAAGMSLRETMAAFSLFRRPILSAIAESGERTRGGALEAAFELFDRFVAAMVEAFFEEVLSPVTGRRSSS